jgi:hypothetical protein
LLAKLTNKKPPLERGFINLKSSTMTNQDLTKLSAKQIMSLLKTPSIQYAQQLLTDIKKHYDIRIVCTCHLLDYLKVPKIQ